MSLIKKTNHIEVDKGKSNYESLLGKLYPLIKPYFKFKGKIDLAENDPTYETSSLLAALLDNRVVIEDNESSKYFCADDILAEQIIIEGNLMKFWGIVYWLQTPNNYEINKTGTDPFYAEFKLIKKQIKINRMKCGDFGKTSLEKIYWFDLNIDWIYDFES